jgi:metal-dependent hydrolase (beta-lactamase superfamily II)
MTVAFFSVKMDLDDKIDTICQTRLSLPWAIGESLEGTEQININPDLLGIVHTVYQSHQHFGHSIRLRLVEDAQVENGHLTLHPQQHLLLHALDVRGHTGFSAARQETVSEERFT